MFCIRLRPRLFRPRSILEFVLGWRRQDFVENFCPRAENAPVSGTSPVAPVGAELESAKAFLGRWDLTLKARDGEYPSWLELRQENGRLVAEFVGRWGNARPLPKAELSNGRLMFISPKEEEGAKADMVFE